MSSTSTMLYRTLHAEALPSADASAESGIDPGTAHVASGRSSQVVKPEFGQFRAVQSLGGSLCRLLPRFLEIDDHVPRLAGERPRRIHLLTPIKRQAQILFHVGTWGNGSISRFTV